MVAKTNGAHEAKSQKQQSEGARSREVSTQKIHAALQKLKSDSNGRELELLNLVASIYESMKDTYESAYESVIGTKDLAIEKTQDAVTTVNNSVHSHPWHYIGGAALIGFLSGLFIRR